MVLIVSWEPKGPPEYYMHNIQQINHSRSPRVLTPSASPVVIKETTWNGSSLMALGIPYSSAVKQVGLVGFSHTLNNAVPYTFYFCQSYPVAQCTEIEWQLGYLPCVTASVV